MRFIIGTKQNMTQFFAEDGRAYACTIIKAEPMVVTEVRDEKRDKYSAVQVGYGIQKKKD